MRHCWECDIENVPFNKHHPIPISRGGKRTILLCEPCHSKAHHIEKNMNISALTKEALRKKMATGWKAGSSDIVNVQKKAQKIVKERANAYALTMQSIFLDMDEVGIKTLTGKAAYLNAEGIKTRRDCKWTPQGVRNVCLRLKEIQKEGEKNEEKRR